VPRSLFPAIYLALLLPEIPAVPVWVRAAAFGTSVLLALCINFRIVHRPATLLATSLLTLTPLVLVAQAAVCSSPLYAGSNPFLTCVGSRSSAVLLNASLLSAVSLLATANEWRGSLVATINGLALPRMVRLMAIVSGAMIGDFGRAISRVHLAFTARGRAMPSIHWRNLLALPLMIGPIWAAVLDGVVERSREQWASDAFWTRYVPSDVRLERHWRLADVAVVAAAAAATSASLLALLA
jgi:hypothetical protein